LGGSTPRRRRTSKPTSWILGYLQKFRDGAKHYVLGRKGSGKTALFKSATPEVLRRDVIPIEFNDYPWETHKLIREGGLPSESAYVASWRFTFLAEICRHWMRAATTDELRREASRFLTLMRRWLGFKPTLRWASDNRLE